MVFIFSVTSSLSSCKTKEFFSVLKASINVCFWIRFSVSALMRFSNSSSLVEVRALVASYGKTEENGNSVHPLRQHSSITKMKPFSKQTQGEVKRTSNLFIILHLSSLL